VVVQGDGAVERRLLEVTVEIRPVLAPEAVIFSLIFTAPYILYVIQVTLSE
jgi:hypothetical protein